MPRYSHQFILAITVESPEKDWDKVSVEELQAALALRYMDIVNHDGIEAFQHNDTEEV